MAMRYISGEDIFERLTMTKCIDLMEGLFVAFSEGMAENKLRSMMPLGDGNILGIMPGLLPYENVSGTKLITIFHDNYKYNMPSHQGIVVIFDNDNGRVKGICDGMAITAIRTAAVSALATKKLANPDASVLCLMGGGTQASMHLEAICRVRDIKQVNVWCPTTEESERFIANHKDRYPGVSFTACATGEEAVKEADIICTVTLSTTPVLKGEWVKKGAHINAVGACAAADRELDSRLVKDSLFYTDSLISCTNESGDYLYPLKEGLIDEGHIISELGDLLTGKKPGRRDREDITVFESLGLAREDIACAVWLLK